VGRARSPVG